jgi:enoyl-[acyl-carrier protein] reductase I
MLLENKNVLIYGVRNARSLAWGCAQSAAREGARLCLTYLVVMPCDLTNEEQVIALHEKIKTEMGSLYGVLHAVAFAKKEDLEGRYVDTSRDGFALALEVSAYTFVTAAKHAAPLMTDGGSLITLSYLGSEKVVPNYNVMGVAKAALEASVRYLAADLGPDGIRVNAISPGPTMTLSARGISGFTDLFRTVPDRAPLRHNTTIDEVGDTFAFLSSPGARGITGHVIYVDSGMHALASF